MQSNRRRTILAASLLLSLATLPAVLAEDAKPVPANPPASSPATAGSRTREAVMADLNAAGKSLQTVLPSLDPLNDEKTRAQLAPTAIPAIKKLVASFDELAAMDPRANAESTAVHSQFGTILGVLGDKDAIEQLTRVAAGNDKQAATAKAALLHIKWWKNAQNPQAQVAAIDEARALLKANADNPELAVVIYQMADTASANAANQIAMENIVIEEAKGPMTQRLIAQAKESVKLLGLLDKPLVIQGVTLDGKSFTSADWKGKVVLVDFWATWCPQCVEAMPRIKKIYADLHPKGLEIVGVSSDNEGGALRHFLSENKEMTWPQLFDPQAQAGHPLALQYGIHTYPRMLLIDKKGIVRTIKAFENFEELIPKLLEEN